MFEDRETNAGAVKYYQSSDAESLIMMLNKLNERFIQSYEHHAFGLYEVFDFMLQSFGFLGYAN